MVRNVKITGIVAVIAFALPMLSAHYGQGDRRVQRADGAKRLALVIGNDHYAALPPLVNAVNDARAMGLALGEADFEVIAAENATLQQLESTLLSHQGMPGVIPQLTKPVSIRPFFSDDIELPTGHYTPTWQLRSLGKSIRYGGSG